MGVQTATLVAFIQNFFISADPRDEGYLESPDEPSFSCLIFSQDDRPRRRSMIPPYRGGCAASLDGCYSRWDVLE